MKRFIINSIKFAFHTVLIYIIVICILGLTKTSIKGLNINISDAGNIKLRINDIANYDSLDILFLGSSHCFMSFDPRIFKNRGYNTFNFGSISQRPIQTKYLYFKYAKNIKTDLIVLELSPLSLNDGGMESNIDLLNSIETNIALSKMSIESLNLNVLNTLVFRSIQDLFRYKVSSPELGPYIKGTGYIPTLGANKEPRLEHKERMVSIISLIKRGLNLFTPF